MKKIAIILILFTLPLMASIGNSNLSINIQDVGNGIGVTSITRNGSQLLNTTTNSDVFTLNLTNTVNNQTTVISSRAGWGSVNISQAGANYSIALAIPTIANTPSTLRVDIALSAANGKSNWDINVTGLGTYTLTEVLMPQLNIKADGNDTMFVPRFSGKLHPNPVANNLNWNRKYPAGWHASMQYMSYYNSLYGLYFGFHDAQANDKIFHAISQSGGMLIEASYPIPDASIAGNNWSMPGVFELDAFAGDWYDAAKIYQSWVTTDANYFPHITAAREVRLNEIGDIAVWTTFSEPPNLVHLATPLTTAFTDYMQVPTGLTWYRWNGLQEDEKYPEYFPPTANMDNQINTMQNHTPKIRVAPYINGRLFDVDLTGVVGDNQFTYADDGKPYAVENSNGLIPTTVYNGFTFATMCPTQSPWQNILINAVDRITGTIGSAGMYIDQIGAARSYSCMDATHGHTLNGGHFWTDGYHEILNGMYNTIDSGKFLTTENGADNILDVMDGLMVQGWQANNQVPAFHVVYSGKVMFYGMKTGASQYRNSLPEFYMKMAQAYAYGVQLGRFFTSFVNETGTVEKAPILVKKLITLRYKLKDFFSYGQMQRPLNISGLPTITATWQDTFDGDATVTIDAIQTSTWLSGKFGIPRYMFNFTNAHVADNDDVTFDFNFNAADYGLTGQLYIQEITENTNSTVVITPNTFTKNITLNSRDSIAYIISTSPNGIDDFKDFLFKDDFEN